MTAVPLCSVQWAKNRGVRCLLRLGDDHVGADHTNYRVVWSDEDTVPGTGNAEARPAATRSVLQEWVMGLPMMQQTVLLTAVRGPDGLPKYHPTKFVLRWYRRCILLSAMDGRVLADPVDPSGGSFTGPSASVNPLRDTWAQMDDRISEYLRSLDEVPHHFQLHLLHAVEIVGYKHPDERIRGWWRGVYCRLVHDMHLWPETEQQMDDRLGDSREGWLARGDVATNG